MLRTVFLALVVSVSKVTADYYGDYSCLPGTDVFVHLFEWKWTDIEKECPILAESGFCGLQVSPPNEHRIITEEDWGEPYPWYQRYQPVSYKMRSRSGTEEEFISMVEACNEVGIRVYVDVILNHMTGGGLGIGSDGSVWDGDTESFPAVPYTTEDFHGAEVCFSFDGNIHDYSNADEVRYCRLFGLRDLKASDDYVQEKLSDFMNTLIDWGVAGFRVDAAKHNFPIHIEEIFDRTVDLNTRWFPAGTRAFVFNEVIDMQTSEPIKGEDYEHIGRVTEFNYGFRLGEILRKLFGQKLAYLRTFGEAWGFMRNETSLVFVDNHDTQRGHGPGGLGSIVSFHERYEYIMGNAFMLAQDFGHARIMSSYNWERIIEGGEDINDWHGPPSDDNGNTNDVECGTDINLGSWICEHRWRGIKNMVNFHNLVMGEPVTHWWDNDEHAIAFSRGDKGFLVMSNEEYPINVDLTTGLPDGEYCDVITCDTSRPPCSGDIHCRPPITVSQGRVNIDILHTDFDGAIALHV